MQSYEQLFNHLVSELSTGHPLEEDARSAAAELLRLKQSEKEGWRYSSELENERKRLQHNLHILENALLKACAGNDQLVNSCISSQGELK